jgi:TolA-binding protein
MISPKYIAMKKQLLLAILMSISSLMTLMGQSAKKSLNYQAVILDPKSIDIPGASISGQPLSKGKVCLKFTFLNSQGNVDYEETQQTTTDEYGLISLSVGTGSYSNGTYKNFESIIWDANVKSMKVAVSYDGCATFKQVSTQSLNYTAYALYAEAVDYKNVRDTPTKLSQFGNDVGYLIPKDLGPIKADIKTNTNQIAAANQTIADNKKSSDQSFLLTNQSISNLDTKVAENTTAIKENSGSISTINSTLTDQQNQISDNRNQISDNRNQISATNNNLNAQIGGLQGQINNTNSTVSNLTGVAELQSNKSTNVQIDATSDIKYPTVKALKVYVDQATLGVALATDLQGIASDLQRLENEKANIASPTFTGTPVLPTGTIGVTQSAIDNSTKLATTAFVQTATAGIALQAAVDAKADKNSPTFTGTPSLPTGTIGITQTSGDNSTKLATTAFVTSAVQNYLPRLTTTERGLISGLVEGLTIWNKTNKQLEVYDGTYWVTMNGNLVSNLNVGDSYGGGIVAYIFVPGDIGYVAGQTHGLIAAIVDQTTAAGVKWFPSTFYDITRTLFGQGLANTISIIAASGGSSLTSYAAGLASNYRGGDYSDWYLPSKDELNKLYQNRAAIGNFATSGIAAYWSSSQKGTFNFKDFTEYAKGITSAWVQLFFTDGDPGGTQKDLGISNLRRVRAVRVF